MGLTPADGNTEDERTVLRFLDLWEHQDLEAMLTFFTDDASYVDMPLPPRHGIDEIRAYIARIFAAFGVRIETLRG